MEEWGLAALPPMAAKLAKHVGCSAEFIHNKIKTIKIPAKLKKTDQEPNKNADNEEGEVLVERASSLYSNAMTQTDDLNEFVGQRKEKGYEIGVQATPETYSIGSQTLETETPANNSLQHSDELPLMNLIQRFNENQLMAIHSFAELIKEQKSGSNAMEMYKIQMQMMDIYKISQMPSTLNAPAQPPIVNNYTTATRQPREQTNLCIQSVKGADGRQFTVNDPRIKSTAYSHAHAYTDRPSPTHQSYSQTYFSAASETDKWHSNVSPSTRHHPYNAHSSQSPPITKRYGRGGFRR